MLPTTYITDCYDDNTKARQSSRIQSLIPQVGSVDFIGVHTSLEAAGNLVDTLDALEGRPGIIFINIAPRGTGRHPNGTPFGYIVYKSTYIFTTVEGEALSLLKKLTGETLALQVFHIPTAVTQLSINTETQQHIINSQFRSFDFLPRVAAAILEGKPITSAPWSEISPCPLVVWWQDNFGNFKTTLLPEDTGFKANEELTLLINGQADRYITATCYERLKDIPYNTMGIYIGSSGLPGKRLLEITLQKGDDLASSHKAVIPLSVGDSLTIKTTGN